MSYGGGHNTGGPGPGPGPGEGPDFPYYRFQARPSAAGQPYEAAFYAPPSNYGVGTFQTIYGSFNSRMRQISDFEPVKHKRSRKGCFTCRARRVKCDETRPRCNRCRKGKRACVFPEERQGSGDGSSKAETIEQQPLDATSGSSEGRVGDETAESSTHEVNSPSDTGSASSAFADQESSTRTAGIPSELEPYMEYFSNSVSHHHYGFLEESKWAYLRLHLAEHALQDDALMFSIVAFAAYLIMISRNETSMEGFLDFYSSSMYLLRTSLQGSSGQRLSVSTLMTVLQLALLEEYLGDWVNLQAHKTAAMNLISEMYTPTLMVEEPLTRILLEWYTKFDQFTAFMFKSQISLSREWYQASCSTRIDASTLDLDEATTTRIRAERVHRLLERDISTVLVALETERSGAASEMDARSAMRSLFERFAQWIREYEPLLLNQAQMQQRPETGDPTAAFGALGDASAQYMWPAKHLLARFWGLELATNRVAAHFNLSPPEASLASQVNTLCGMLDHIQRNDPHPHSILGQSAGVGVASLTIRADPRWAGWSQEKVHSIVSKGYLFPSTLYKQMVPTSPSPTSATSEPGPSLRARDQQPVSVHTVREWVDERSKNQLGSDGSQEIERIVGILGASEIPGPPPT